MEESRRDGIETIEGIRRIKAELPGVYTVLGLSNVSFGLNPAARQVLNSVFLHECVEAGLDAAIVHASKILPLAKIDDRAREVCLDLIYDRRADGYDPLTELLALFEGVVRLHGGGRRGPVGLDRRAAARAPDHRRRPQRHRGRPRRGHGPGLTPLVIINEFLLAGMKTVGELFASGEMQLPFVLGSAETMKTAVAYLEPFMEKADQGGKGTMVLATVKGDVHDIGKNLVDIILTNNGYTVRNLGIKIGIAEMVAAVEEFGADAIGMSGLLVKSTLIMRENLEELNRRGLSHIPVILGGAALTRTYVERDLRQVYDGRLFYGKDAFEGLRTMDRLVELAKTGEDDPEFGTELGGRDLGPARASCASRPPTRRAPGASAARPRPGVATDNPVFAPALRGQPGGQGDGHRRHRRLPQRDGPVPQPVGLPSRGRRGRPRVQGAGPVRAPRGAGHGQGRPAAGAPGGLGPLRRQRRRRRPGDLDQDETRTTERMRFAFPRQVEDPYLCIADFFRTVESGERGLGQLPGGDHGVPGVRGGGPAVRRRRVPAVPLPPRAGGRDGRGTGRVLAPPHPRGARASPTRTAPP